MVQSRREVDHRLSVHGAFLDQCVFDFGELGDERLPRLSDDDGAVVALGSLHEFLDLAAHVADAGDGLVDFGNLVLEPF